MDATQSAVARIERGRAPLNIKTLARYTRAAGRRIAVKLVSAA